MDDRIKAVMAAVLGVDAGAIGDDSSVRTLGQWDSLKHMNLLLALEEEFGIQFSDEDLPSLTSFPTIREAVAALVR